MDNPHINPAFDSAISDMDELLQQMEDAVAMQISVTRTLFTEMNLEQAQAVYQKDAKLNSLSKQVEEHALSVLAKHQPVAEDLRRTIGALKMSIEYERAADYVKHLAKSIGRITAHDDNEKPLIFASLDRLAAEVEKMFARFLSARRNNDLELAIAVWMKDQKIDDLCSETVREAFANQQQGIGNVHSLIHSVSAAKNIERIGDKIKNLVEIFYQQKTGKELDI